MVKTNTPLPLIDLGRQYQSIKREVDGAIAKVLEGAQFIRGPQHNAFAREFARYCGVSSCAPLASGTDALYLALRALNIGPGDEVVTVPMTFIATVEMLVRAGVKPIFVDVDPITYCMNPAQLGNKISSKTKAVLPVHLYGHPADMDPINAFARERGLFVIEDAAQAHGALYKGRRVGSLGVLGCFSFYPSKNLGAYGDGGAVVSDKKDLIERILKLGNHGCAAAYNYEEEGINSRLDEMQAAVLRVKLKYLDAWNAQRRRVAQLYGEVLKGVGDLVLPQQASECESVFHLYVIQTSRRDDLGSYLKNEGIASQVHYPAPLHLLRVFRFLDLKEGAYPMAERICRRALSLPMFPEMTTDEVGLVADKIGAFFKR